MMDLHYSVPAVRRKPRPEPRDRVWEFFGRVLIWVGFPAAVLGIMFALAWHLTLSLLRHGS